MQHCTACGETIPPGDTRCPHCGRAHYGAVCPQCSQPAPTLIRGGKVICSGCGATRGPLSGVPLNMVGSAHRVGGVVTSVLGWVFILSALAVGGLLGLVVGLLASNALLGVGLGLGLGALGGAAGGLALAGGRRLGQRGSKLREDAVSQSIVAMAGTRNGAVTALEVSQNLGIPLKDADAVLTDMTRRGHANVEVSAEGLVHYVFPDVRLVAMAQRNAPTGVRVTTETAGPMQEKKPAEVARERVDREYEAMERQHRTGRL